MPPWRAGSGAEEVSYLCGQRDSAPLRRTSAGLCVQVLGCGRGEGRLPKSALRPWMLTAASARAAGVSMRNGQGNTATVRPDSPSQGLSG